jgi:hypothetical protein
VCCCDVRGALTCVEPQPCCWGADHLESSPCQCAWGEVERAQDGADAWIGIEDELDGQLGPRVGGYVEGEGSHGKCHTVAWR